MTSLTGLKAAQSRQDSAHRSGTRRILADGTGFVVSAVGVYEERGKSEEWREATWLRAQARARRARRKHQTRLIFFSDWRSIWRLEELE